MIQDTTLTGNKFINNTITNEKLAGDCIVPLFNFANNNNPDGGG